MPVLHGTTVPLTLGPVLLVLRSNEAEGFDCPVRHLAVSAASAARRQPGLPPASRFAAESKGQSGYLLVNKLDQGHWRGIAAAQTKL